MIGAPRCGPAPTDPGGCGSSCSRPAAHVTDAWCGACGVGGHRLHGPGVRRWAAPTTTVRYRVWFEDRRGAAGPPRRAASARPGRARDRVRFVWSGDCAGQGWGINPEWGGMRGFEAMRQEAPDFFVFSGDTVYADGPLLARGRAVRRHALAQPHHAREVQGRRDARRVPGSVALQPARRQRAPVQRRGAGHRPVGRPRGDEQLVSRRGPHRRRVPTPGTPRSRSTPSPRAPTRRSTSTSR